MSRHDQEFTDFMLSASGRLLRAAMLLTGDLVQAEDLVQRALARAFARWGNVRHGNPEAYVRRTMMNDYLDWWRRRRWREVPETALESEPASDDHAADTERRLVVRQALATLTDKERAVVVLLFWYDQTEVQVSVELGIAVGTVKSTRARALRRLREHGLLAPSVEEAAPALGASEHR